MTWGSPKPATSYTAFVSIMDAVGHQPFWATASVPGDLVAGKPTTASSTETAALPAAYATDGDTGTRWSSAFSDPQWLRVDLGSVQTVNQVRLVWDAHGKAYQIQMSNDAKKWTTIFTKTNGTGGTETLTGFTGTGRYIRILGTQRGTVWGYSLYEFQVFNDLALNRPTTASSMQNPSLPPGGATDGNQATRWSSAFSDPQWLRVDLGSVQTVNQVQLVWDAHGKAYQIQMSNDAKNWNTVSTKTNGTGGAETFSPTSNGGTETLILTGAGRYIRILGTQRGTVWGYSLWSLQVFNTPAWAVSPHVGPIYSSVSGTCVGDDANSGANGTEVQIRDCNGGAAQPWTYANRTLTVNGKCMDVTGRGRSNGTPVRISDCTGGTNQQWVAQPDGSLASVQSGKCLTNPAGITHGRPRWPNRTQLTIWTCNGGTNQKWTLP